MGDRVAWFGGVRLGDVLRSHEELTLGGADPNYGDTVFAKRASSDSHNGGSRFEAAFVAHMMRGYVDPSGTHGDANETPAGFMKRKLDLLSALLNVRNAPAPLVVLGDDEFNTATSVWSPIQTEQTPAGPVEIETDFNVLSVAGETWAIIRASGSVEFVTITTGGWSNLTEIANLVEGVGAGDLFLKPEWWWTSARLHSGIRIPGNAPGATEFAADIPLLVSSTLDPTGQT